MIENVYRLQIMNATEAEQRYRIRAAGLPELRLAEIPPVVVDPAAARWVPGAVRLPPAAAATAGPGSHRIEFTIEQLAPGAAEAIGRALVEKSTFVVPR